MHHCSSVLFVWFTRIGSGADSNAHPVIHSEFQGPCGNFGEQRGNRLRQHDKQRRGDADRGHLSLRLPFSQQRRLEYHLDSAHRPGHRFANPLGDPAESGCGAARSHAYEYQHLWRQFPDSQSVFRHSRECDPIHADGIPVVRAGWNPEKRVLQRPDDPGQRPRRRSVPLLGRQGPYRVDVPSFCKP